MYVRANAATLFLDAFPLQDPDWTREEMDTVMQKQFDAMTVGHTFRTVLSNFAKFLFFKLPPLKGTKSHRLYS